MTFEAVTYESIPHALVSGIIISILCSAVGLFLVLRKYSLFGDALAHSAFGGVAFGLFIGFYPLWIACIVAILSALGLTKIRQKFDISSDAIVAILLATGLGAGVILISMTDDMDLHDIEEFLFGSAIIDTQNVITILVMAGAILTILFLTYKKLLYSTFSEEQAKASGIPVDKTELSSNCRRWSYRCHIDAAGRGTPNLSTVCAAQRFGHALRALLQADHDALNVLCGIRYRLGHLHLIPV